MILPATPREVPDKSTVRVAPSITWKLLLAQAPLSAGQYDRFALTTEAGAQAVLHQIVPANSPAGQKMPDLVWAPEEARLYIPDLAAVEDLAAAGLVPWLRPAQGVHILECRGLGEAWPDGGGSAFSSVGDDQQRFKDYGQDYMMHGHALLFGESYLGRRVYDCLSALRLLRASGATHVTVVGRGQGSLVALFAAVVDDGGASLELYNHPQSCAEWVAAPDVQWPAANFVKGLLQHLDLSDCRQALGSRLIAAVRARHCRGCDPPLLSKLVRVPLFGKGDRGGEEKTEDMQSCRGLGWKGEE